MKRVLWLILGGLTVLPPAAWAGPYFHWMTPLQELKSGVFVKTAGGGAAAPAYGFQTTLLKHSAEDGYFLLPGVSWSLLDVGAAKTPTGAFQAVVGPSIDLSEPIKAVLLRGVRAAWPGTMGAAKALLAPSEPGKACVALSAGPGFGLEAGDLLKLRDYKGSLAIHFGLSAKWGN
jgi:hypothetical protein